MFCFQEENTYFKTASSAQTLSFCPADMVFFAESAPLSHCQIPTVEFHPVPESGACGHAPAAWIHLLQLSELQTCLHPHHMQFLNLNYCL